MPRAVSSRAYSGTAATAATRLISSGPVTSGSRSPLRPAGPAVPGARAARSLPAQGLSRALTRTCTGTGGGPASRSAVTARAYSLRSVATASSRSITTASAPAVSALATLRGRSPGT
jgi:hypothetical protein